MSTNERLNSFLVQTGAVLEHNGAAVQDLVELLSGALARIDVLKAASSW